MFGVQRQYSGTAGRIRKLPSRGLSYLRGPARVRPDRPWPVPTTIIGAGSPIVATTPESRPKKPISLPNRRSHDHCSTAPSAPTFRVLGCRRRGLRRRSDTARRHPRPPPGLRAGHRRHPVCAHPRRQNPRRSAPGDAAESSLANTLAGAGSDGHRYYSWGWISLEPEDATDTGYHYLLIRRNDKTRRAGLPALLLTPASHAAHPRAPSRGQRWRIEESFQTANGLTGLDQHQVSRWRSWHRWITLAMLAHAFLAVACAIERDTQPHPRRTDHIDGQRVPPPLRRPTARRRTHHHQPAGLVTMATTTPTPSPPIPLPGTRTPMITIYGCGTRSRLSGVK